MKKKSFERKNELIEAAFDEFTSRSYDNASLNSIIKNAGISKGTFYYHFQDKQALYLFLNETVNKVKWDFMNNYMKKHTENFGEKDIFERFKLLGQIGIEFNDAFPKYGKLGAMFTKEKGSKIYEHVMSVLGSNEEVLLEEIIKQGIKDGDFNNRFSDEFIVKIIKYISLNYDEIFINEDCDLESMLKEFSDCVDFVKYGLGK
jgi:TetR/AcrR family transcriptional regulator